MSAAPMLKAREVIQALFNAGFRIIRSRGSHFRFQHPISGRRVTVSFHPGDISRKLLFSILRQAGLTLVEFLEYLRGK